MATPHTKARRASRFCLINLGLGGIGRGIAYLPSMSDRGPVPAGIQLISSHGLGLTFWSVLWIATGVICICCAFFKEPRTLGTAGVVGMTYVWAFAYFLAWILGMSLSQRDWLGGLTYLVFANVLLGGAILARVALLATSRKD